MKNKHKNFVGLLLAVVSITSFLYSIQFVLALGTQPAQTTFQVYKYARNSGSTPGDIKEIFDNNFNPVSANYGDNIDILLRVVNTEAYPTGTFSLFETNSQLQLTGSDVWIGTGTDFPLNINWDTTPLNFDELPSEANPVTRTIDLYQSLFVLYRAQIDPDVPADTVINAPFTVRYQNNNYIQQNDYPPIIVLPPVIPPQINITNLPARDDRLYNDDGEIKFKMAVSNYQGGYTISGDGIGQELNHLDITDNTVHSVIVPVACSGTCTDGEKTMTITLDNAQTITQQIKFTVDNEAPTLLDPEPDSNLDLVQRAQSKPVSKKINSIEGGLSEAGTVRMVLEKRMEDSSSETYEYELQTDADGRFLIEGIESGTGANYAMILSYWDKAGNLGETGAYFYTLNVPTAPYYLSTYNVSPWSPTTPPAAGGSKEINFELEVAKGSTNIDIQGVDLYASQCLEGVCNDLLRCLDTNPQGACDLTALGPATDTLFGAQGTIDWTVRAEECPGTGCNYRLFFDVRQIGGDHYVVSKDSDGNPYQYEFNSTAGESVKMIEINEQEVSLCAEKEPGDCRSTAVTSPGSNLIPIFAAQLDVDTTIFKDRKVEIEIYDNLADIGKELTHAKISGIPLSKVSGKTEKLEFKHRYFVSGASRPFEPEHDYYLRLRLTDPVHQIYPAWDGTWFVFKLQRGDFVGSSLPLSQLVSGQKVADEIDQYNVSLILLDQYGNYVQNLTAALVPNALLNTTKNIYFDSLNGAQGGTTAITLGGNLALGSEYIYSGGWLRSAAPSVFPDKEYAVDQSDLEKTVLNRARGLVLARDLDLGVKLSDDPDKEIWPAQSVKATYFKDSDGDEYSDGLELTYGTAIDKDTEYPGYLDKNFTTVLVPCWDTEGSSGHKVKEVNSFSLLNETNCPLARLSGDDNSLYYFPSLASEGEYAPAVKFLPPLSVTLQKLYKTEAGSWVAEHTTDELFLDENTENWSSDPRLILPKIEMLAEEEGRLRLELKNIGSPDTVIALNNINFKLRNYFSFAGEQARFNDLTFVKAYRGMDPVNMPVDDEITNADIDITATGELFLNGGAISDLASGEIIWLDFSVRPGVYGNLITSRAYYNCEMELPMSGEKVAAFPCSPEIIDLYRAESYIGVTQTLEEADRDLKLKKVKEEMIANIMSETRPLPAIGAETAPVYLGALLDDEDGEGQHFELLDSAGNLQAREGLTSNEVTALTSANLGAGEGIYRNASVYAFRGRNVIIGDGINPVDLPADKQITIVVVGGNLIIASDIVPAPSGTAKALGLVSIWDTERENANKPSDPISETSWNEAYKGGNILINSKAVKNVFSHLFAEGAVFNIDLDDEATQSKHLSSLYDILSGKFNNSYHFETKRQNTEDQLLIHGLFASYNTFRGAAEDKPYSEKTTDYLKFNERLDLSYMRVFRGEGISLVGEASTYLEEQNDTRALVIEPATDYGLPTVFQTKEDILMGEGTPQ